MLIRLIAEARQLLFDADELDTDFREFLLVTLARIDDAIVRYHIRGAAGFERSLNETVGAFVARYGARPPRSR
jgi:hypothetical protein